MAAAGILTSLAFRRWLRTSAGLPLAATLIAVIVLTLGAFSSWPSWLQPSFPAAPVLNDSNLQEVSILSSPAESQSVSLGVNDTFAQIFGLKYQEWLLAEPLNPALESAQSTASIDAQPTRWSWQKTVLLLILGGLIVGLTRLIGGLWGIRILARSSRPLEGSVAL